MAKIILSIMLVYFTIMNGVTGGLTGTLFTESTKEGYCELLYRIYIEEKEISNEQTEETLESVIETELQ